MLKCIHILFRKRRCPPAVMLKSSLPCWAQSRTVTSDTLSHAATSLGLSQLFSSTCATAARVDSALACMIDRAGDTVPCIYSAHMHVPSSDINVFSDFSEFCITGIDASQSAVNCIIKRRWMSGSAATVSTPASKVKCTQL